MLITFPHIGNIYMFIKVIFDALGVNYIIPPPCSKRTFELGIKNAPEMVCMPLKINLGNFIEGIEQGADTVVITGGCGPCRFGYYGEMHKEMLKAMGYTDVKVITIDNSVGVRELIKRLKAAFNNSSLIAIFFALLKACKVIDYADRLDRMCYKLRPREIIKGETDRIINRLPDEIRKTAGYKGVMRVLRETDGMLKQLEIDNKVEPLKVGLVGDIYTLIEPSTNLYIEKMLGEMGMEVDKSLYITKWINEHIIKIKVNRKEKRHYEKVVRPYLKEPIGGFARESLGHSAMYAEKGFDGVIQVYPLTCMPEIVSSSILPQLSKDYDIPVLTLIIDEMTGEAGYRTRIEAFQDLMMRRKEKRESELVFRN